MSTCAGARHAERVCAGDPDQTPPRTTRERHPGLYQAAPSAGATGDLPAPQALSAEAENPAPEFPGVPQQAEPQRQAQPAPRPDENPRG